MRPRSAALAAALLSIVLLGLSTVFARAQGTTASKDEPALNRSSPATSSPVKKDDAKTKIIGSYKVRVDDFNWFPTTKANGAYTFAGSVLRFGVARTSSTNDAAIEFEQPTLLGMPTRASAASPTGASGPGANYYSTDHSWVASIFLKQAYDRIKWPQGKANDSFRFGRFEYHETEEVTPADATIKYTKQMRIMDRLISPPNYSFIARSLDGVQYLHDAKPWNVSVIGAMPTRGGYSLDGWDTLDRIKLGYVGATLAQPGKRAAGESRLFAVVYADERTNIVKVDNRTTAGRTADKEGIHIITLGAHDLRAVDLGPGRFDTLLWAAGQVGSWGMQSQLAYSYDAEIGYQFTHAPWKPWFRAAYDFGSGDGKSNDSVHGTFFPILPASRQYARFPFYNESNIKDAFGQVILTPARKLVARADVHGLQLASSKDLWYSGSGAYDDTNFGYSGKASGGHDGLGVLYDISLDYQFNKNLGGTLYLAYVHGGAVVTNTYPGGANSDYAYYEMMYRF